MKKSFPVNINGTIYYIDEDAYNLLNNYLEQLRHTFSTPQESEVVDDIEARIHEHIASDNQAGKIITAAQVRDIISIIGSPEDISGRDDTQPRAGEPGTVPPYNYNAPYYHIKKKLYRDLDDKVFGGVISGLAQYFGCSVVALRIIVLLLAFIYGIAFVVYLIAWIAIPAAVTPRQRLEMEGIPVTPDNIARTMSMEMETQQENGNNDRSSAGVLGTIVSTCAKIIMAFVGGISSIVGVSCAFASIILLATAIGFAISSPEFMYNFFDIEPALRNLSTMSQIGVLSASSMITMAIALPAIALTWLACCVLLKAKAPSRGVIIAGVIIEIILIIASVALLAASLPDHNIHSICCATTVAPLSVVID